MTINRLTSRHIQAIEIATRLVESVRTLSKTFPEEEDMVMVPQIREAVMELHKAAFMAGHVENRQDFFAYTDDIRGKVAALKAFIDLALSLEYCDETQHAALTADIEKIADLIEPPAKPVLKLVE